jgi:hypothetical protein
MILSVEKSKRKLSKLLELVNQFGKFAEYKSNIQKSEIKYVEYSVSDIKTK